MKQLTPQQVKERLNAGEKLTIIDVRNAWEVQAAQVDGTLHIEMDEIPDALDRIPRDHPVVIMCHSGGRSAAVTNWLTFQGFENVYNLVGGIDRWSVEVDPSVPRY
ncbi:MAG: rhodanese-like domain-containing protein [Anaerolineae bacterium]